MSTAAEFDGYPDVPGNMRAALARKRRGSSYLERTFGKTQSYWSRKINGVDSWKPSDIEAIALVAEVHPAELFGGTAPDGWTPPPCPGAESNRWPTAYKARGSHLSIVPKIELPHGDLAA